MFELLYDVLVDSVIDTAKLLPFLFITYVAMEALEHSTSGRLHERVASAGKAGPIIGALLGVVPQCGFSAMAATLFSGGVITFGTLLAVLLSTSDEMIPVFAAHPGAIEKVVPILGIKVLVAILAGLFLDLVIHVLWHTAPAHHIHDLCEREECGCDEEAGHDHAHAHVHEHEAVCTCGHDHDHEHVHTHVHAHDHGAECFCGHDHSHTHEGSTIGSILHSALVHTVQVTIFIFAATFVLGLIVEGVGEDVIGGFFAAHPTWAVLFASLFGLIPNCASSVIISELYLNGTLAAPAMLAGLLAAGGSGLLVLFRTNNDLRENLLVTACLLAVAIGVGVIARMAGVAF